MFSRNKEDTRMIPRVYRWYIVNLNGKRFYETEHRDLACKVMEELRTLWDHDHPYKYEGSGLAVTLDTEYRVVHNGGNCNDPD